MSKYRITLEGEGPFDTTERDYPLDANRLLDRFRESLVSGGHKVISCDFRGLPDEEPEDDEPTGPGGTDTKKRTGKK